MITGLTAVPAAAAAAVRGCVSMCVVHAQTFVHIHAQASARAHILQEMRHCVFRASQTAP